MQLKEIYIREVYLKKFCEDLEDSLQLTEEINNSALTDLLKQAETTIFPRFGIKSSEPNKYFIAGSARLHLYPFLYLNIRKIFAKSKKGDINITLNVCI